MKIILFGSLGVAAFALGMIALSFQLRYRISRNYLRVTLFGITIRRVRLLDIRNVSKRRARWSENWWNTLHPNHHILTIHRYSGLFEYFSITPKNRYVFLADLQDAIEDAKAARQVAEKIQNPSPAEEQSAEKAAPDQGPAPGKTDPGVDRGEA